MQSRVVHSGVGSRRDHSPNGRPASTRRGTTLAYAPSPPPTKAATGCGAIREAEPRHTAEGPRALSQNGLSQSGYGHEC